MREIIKKLKKQISAKVGFSIIAGCIAIFLGCLIFNFVKKDDAVLVELQKNIEEIKKVGDNQQIYRNERYGFELEYPEDWEINIREAVILFASNGPIGDSFGFMSPEKTIHNSPFWISVGVVENIQYTDAIAYFDFVHRGDVCVYDGYETVKLGANQNKFLKITEKSGSYIAYIKVKNGNYYEISFFNPKIDDLYQQAEEIVNTFTLEQ